MNKLKQVLLGTVSLFAVQEAAAQCAQDGPPELRGFAGVQYQTTGGVSAYSQKPVAVKAGLQLEFMRKRFSPLITASVDYPFAGGAHGGESPLMNGEGLRAPLYKGEKQYGGEVEGFIGFGGSLAPVVYGPVASFNMISARDGDKSNFVAYPEFGLKVMARQDAGYMRLQFTAKACVQMLNPDGKRGHATFNVQAGTVLRF